MSSPDLTAADVAAVNDVLETRYLSLGPQLVAFEEAFAAAVGVRHAVGVNSGTSGLHLSVIAAGIEENDLVITTPFSFIASANCVLFERAIPIFVDVDPQTLNIDPAQVAQAADHLSRGGDAAKRWLPPAIRNSQCASRHLKAILPVDAFGQPADYDAIRAVAVEHDLWVIEDSCEAIGATYKGRPAGTLGDAAVFAFYPNKQITAGEGGMIVTDRDDWAALFRSLRNQGRDVFDAWLNHTRLGYNYRLDEMSAALGLSQLKRIEELLEKRERVAGWYKQRLAGVEGIQVPYVAPSTTRMSWFVYVVRIAPAMGCIAPAMGRDRVMQALKARGIPSRPYFTPIHLQPFYRERFGYQRGRFPVTEMAGDTCLALPFSGVMEERQVDRVCAVLRDALT
ncbi:MAG TPA: DegT/DnrJ/EryC1/StrS family aminotransferase [Chloroflexi bacterium]|nr:DegT/DnrJ/EryC1/StrS family aminotransferase [Chloroflexota bacterium]